MSNQRRNFLKVSALAGGVALTVPLAINQAEAAGPAGQARSG